MIFIVHDNLTSCWMVCIDWDFFPGGLPYLWLPLIGYSGYSDRLILSEKGKCFRRSDGRTKHRSFRETCVPTLPGQLPCFHFIWDHSWYTYWPEHERVTKGSKRCYVPRLSVDQPCPWHPWILKSQSKRHQPNCV